MLCLSIKMTCSKLQVTSAFEVMEGRSLCKYLQDIFSCALHIAIVIVNDASDYNIWVALDYKYDRANTRSILKVRATHHWYALVLPMNKKYLKLKCFFYISLSNIRIFTFRGILEVPISSLSCFPVEAVMAISFISFRRPFTPFTSNIFVIFSLTVSAGSKSL